jgi:hypothetical protein
MWGRGIRRSVWPVIPRSDIPLPRPCSSFILAWVTGRAGPEASIFHPFPLVVRGFCHLGGFRHALRLTGPDPKSEMRPNSRNSEV